MKCEECGDNEACKFHLCADCAMDPAAWALVSERITRELDKYKRAHAWFVKTTDFLDGDVDAEVDWCPGCGLDGRDTKQHSSECEWVKARDLAL